MNLQSAKIRNLQKHGSVLLFILILLFSFVLLNMAVDPFSRRATRPSNQSNKAAKKIQTTALVQSS